MALTTSAPIQQLAALCDAAGFRHADVPLLQPVEPFLDLSGEDIRRRLFLTGDAEGRELCLRPEFTIPLCRQHLAGEDPASRQDVYAIGPVFRHRTGESGEFLQASIESIGNVDCEAADADVLALAIRSVEALGASTPHVRMNDIGLLEAVLGGLGLSASTTRRIKRQLAMGHLPAVPETSVAEPAVGDYAGVLTALEGADRAAARAFVQDMLSIAGIASAGGRTAAEIADRFLDKARAGNGLSADKHALLMRFLAIDGDPDHIADEVRRFAGDAGIAVENALAAFEARTGFMAAQGIDLGRIRCATRFIRSLDYYTGMVFEIRASDDGAAKPLVAGGRYDGLLRRLGADRDIPAVGCSIWLERFGGRA
jgi:ATP phosphoribosyltransferase regulatory subunit